MSLLLLACLCGAAASGAPTSLRDLSKSELDDYCQRHRGDGDAQLLGGEPTSTDDDGFTASQCWSQMIACVDVEYATPDFSADGIFIATDASIRRAVKLWGDDEAKATKKYGHISTWETGSVTNMAFLFCVREEWMEHHTWDLEIWINGVYRRDLPYYKDACVLSSSSFNDDIASWNTSAVTSMRAMFSNAVAFNQSLGEWDVSKVTNMDSMFNVAMSFNQPIGDWSVHKVERMYMMFFGASAFNQPIGDWQVDKVTDMSRMFGAAVTFNQPLGGWRVERVMDISGMFNSATSFNQDLSGWPINNVANMESMFLSASAFDQDLGWCVRDDVDLDNAFNGTKCASTVCGVNKARCHSKHKSKKETKKERNVALIIASVLFACLLLLGCVLGSYRRKRTELELERSEIVQEQVTAARDQIQEFQAHFVTIAGPRFLAFDRLRPHEECRESDELIVYDLVADVHDASTRGEVFIFFSHQWLGWSEPDPQRIHVKAMQQAVRAVSADADTPLEKIRVWVDYVSIPQKNHRERALAIASLPTFASVSD